MNKTTIQWTNKTWNPVTGCTKVSQGCKHCYAKGVAERFWAGQYPPNADGSPRTFTDVRIHPDRLDAPIRWQKPSLIFVNSMSDLFHEDVPDSFIDEAFAVISLAPQHTFQILTKRPKRMREYFSSEWYRRVFSVHRRRVDNGSFRMPKGYDAQFAIGQSIGALTCGVHVERFLPNVWLGVSCEDQKTADERIPILLQTPATVRFISAEPLLGPIKLDRLCRGGMSWIEATTARVIICNVVEKKHDPLDWVIVGGESGRGARPMDEAWAREIRDACAEGGVAFFLKQMGGANGKRGELEDIPEDLRIREYPKQVHV